MFMRRLLLNVPVFVPMLNVLKYTKKVKRAFDALGLIIDKL